MKKILLTAFTMAAFATTNYAQSAAVETQTAPAVNGAATASIEAAPQAAAQQTSPEKTQVAKESLPQPIQALLASDTYKDQQFEDAWLVKGDTEVYIVNLKNGDAKTQLKLNKEGKVVS